MLLQSCALGVTMSWDDGFLGARASRPHQAWHSLGHLPHLDQPGTAPWLSFGLADGVPADRVAACGIALKLSGGQRDRMRAQGRLTRFLPCNEPITAVLRDVFSEKKRLIVHDRLRASNAGHEGLIQRFDSVGVEVVQDQPRPALHNAIGCAAYPGSSGPSPGA